MPMSGILEVSPPVGPFWAEDAPSSNNDCVQEAQLLRMYAPEVEPRPGSLRSDEVVRDSHWHFHDMHQIMCPFEGSFILEVERGRHLIPRNLAVWIPAGARHRMSLNRVKSTSVFLPTAMVEDVEPRVRVILVSSLMREMLMEASRWPLLDQDGSDVRQLFFDLLAGLSREWIEREADLFLPTSDNPQIRKALDFTVQHMDAKAPDVCRDAGMSERSLRRHLKQETGLTWEAFRRRHRLLRAISLLGETDAPIADVASQCGFECPSAFARTFRAAMHESPRAYREMVRRN